MLDYTFDESMRMKYGGICCGCDEAGRGPLAGPVLAAAVVLPSGLVIPGLDDSKKLSEKKRELLYGEIITSSLAYGIAMCTHEEIDEMNILNASLTAMKRAADIVRQKLRNNASTAENDPISIVLIDGNRNFDFMCPSETVVHGDAVSPSIAAASVLAKVTRDRLMVELDEKYPLYNFKKHKGYPTKEHMVAVYRYGPCEIHRKTFLGFLETKREMLEAESAKLDEKQNLSN